MAQLGNTVIYGDLLVNGDQKVDTLESIVSTGTAPLIIASTTAVTNLNADMVDGVHASALATLASPTFTGTPLSTTPTTGDNSTKIATTAFVYNTKPYLASTTAPTNLNLLWVDTN